MPDTVRPRLASAVAIAVAPLAALAWPSPARAGDTITIAGVGDVLWGRYREDPKKYDPVPNKPDPFADVKPVLQAADIAFANLECPAMEEPKKFYVYRTLTFRADPDKLDVMKEAGFDVISIANNHMFNVAWTAPAETRRHCDERDVVCVGAGDTWAQALSPRLVQVGDKRVAFFAYTWIMNAGTAINKKGPGAVAYFERPKDFLAHALPAARAARRYLGADFVVVSLHWGAEYQDHPESGRVQAARKLVDEGGVDLIIGHHPHWVQDVERYENAVIAYSLGNFMFDNPALEQVQSVILVATLAMPGPLRHVSAVELEPVLIDRRAFVPMLARGRAGQAWRKRLAGLARGIPIRPEPAVAGAAEPR